MPKIKGKIVRISGPVIEADNMHGSKMYDVVRVGTENLIGEIIRLNKDVATIQVYEDTNGLKPGEPVLSTQEPLSVELGPGLIANIYDGIQRPLPTIRKETGDFIARGVESDALDRKKKWHFKPIAKKGATVIGGDILGEVQETSHIIHRIMVPPQHQGTIESIVKEGDYTIDTEIVVLNHNDKTHALTMIQRWPVRKPRPVKNKNDPSQPLITGQRVVDTFFPVAKGGTAAIPGGFGTGKTVMLHQLAKWSDAQIVIYVGCGERGNEMTDVLQEFPKLEDPATGEPLINRTVLIANTSNMPVAARDASVYTGITIAEYYRDMGYDVALMADSTSRWAEAMREISGRLEEMPGEEGYPAYLASRLAEFYERAGRVNTIGSQKREGSVSVMGAVSPPGGDFSEPVAQNTLRIVKVFWALDADLADRRHFPSINWLKSYSLYLSEVSKWWGDTIGKDWLKLRNNAMALLQKESELQEIVKLVGPDALPARERALLESAKMIRENYLQQSAFHEIDTYCPEKKQYEMLRLMLKFSQLIEDAVSKQVHIDDLIIMKTYEGLARMGKVPNEDYPKHFKQLEHDLEKEIQALIKERVK
ncbi:MAG: ATP synthase subunit A [Candidatus Thermoplasmatota archaeon]|nr:ATP synthase subunit A [Candidatus Thermoplasmatota archaeon]MBU1941802.1 ATP synthase subunit A [Candidatus Thermoplasmatota archaeon]